MTFRKLALMLLGLACLASSAAAQTEIPLRKGGGSRSGITSGLEMNAGKMMDVRTLPITHDKYSDDKLGELEKQMEERKWGSEDTAWERACSLGTKDAFQKYIAIYPNGPHRAEATKKIVDIEVDDILHGEHNDLPGMKRVDPDDDSPTSTITVENATQYRLTVMYSGPESRSIEIIPGGKGTVTLPNGHYRIGAFVPVGYVRPYAGSEEFAGGRYETGYIIVSY